MNKIKNKTIGLLLVGCFVFSLLGGGSVWAHDNKKVLYKTPTPKGYDKYITLIANGDYQSVDGSLMLDGLFPGDGLNFQKNVLGRNDLEIEQSKNEAIAFFKQRFGLDAINGPDTLYFTGFQLDPQVDFRAYVVSGEAAPSQGWPAYGGGWALYVFDPEGMTLGGEFEGVHVDFGTSVTLAEYFIQRPDNQKPIVIHKRSLKPVRAPGVGGQVTVIDEYYTDEFGGGINFAVGNFKLVNGLVNFTAKIVITSKPGE